MIAAGGVDYTFNLASVHDKIYRCMLHFPHRLTYDGASEIINIYCKYESTKH